jgi:hypothetical protein
MRDSQYFRFGVALAANLAAAVTSASAFEGKIEIVTFQGSESSSLRYTVGADSLRIETTGNTAPNPIDIFDLKTGALTLIFPHNRSLLRLKSGSTVRESAALARSDIAIPRPSDIPGTSPMPPPPGGLPPGVGPQPTGIPPGGPSNGAARSPGVSMPPISVMPAMPMPTSMTEKFELKSTGKKETILGFPCEQFEVKSRGETMEIWATDKLLPFQSYLRNQRPRFGPPMLEEQWPALLTAKKLFPLRVVLHSDGDTVRFRFEVKSIKPEKIEDKDGKLFQPPSDYSEIQPLPF